MVAALVLSALAGCDQPSLHDADAQEAVKDIPGVVGATAECSNPIESGPSCVLVVKIEPDLDAKKIMTIIDKAKPALVDDVDDIRIVTGEVSLTLAVARLDVMDLGVDELITMRDLDHVVGGHIDVRGSGSFVVEAETDSLDAGLDIATALRSDEIPHVTVTGAGLMLITESGLPTTEFAFARHVPRAVSGVSLMRVAPGQVTAYCTGAEAQAAAKAKVPSLPGYSDIGVVDVFQDAP